MPKKGRPQKKEQIETVLTMVAQGKSYRYIAKALNIHAPRVAYIMDKYSDSKVVHNKDK